MDALRCPTDDVGFGFGAPGVPDFVNPR